MLIRGYLQALFMGYSIELLEWYIELRVEERVEVMMNRGRY